MRNERRLMYQQKKISELEVKVKDLTQENSVLLKENSSLHNMVDSMQLSIEEMQSNHDAAMDRLNNDIKEVKEIKTKYYVAVKRIKTMQKNYKYEMDTLLARLESKLNHDDYRNGLSVKRCKHS